MNGASLKLRDLSPAARLGMTCILLVLLGGLATSASQIYLHHQNRDEKPGLSLDDFRGAYHGVRAIAPMITQLQAGHPLDVETDLAVKLADDDRRLLLTWLQSDRISEDYDNLDLGDLAPAEVIAGSCLLCHSRTARYGDGIGERVPLDFWDDVKNVAFSRNISPMSVDVLITSTHTHALSLAGITLVVALLLLATSWPKRLVYSAILLTGAALLADLCAQWLARSIEVFVWVMLIAGCVYGAMMTLTTLAIIADLWLPRKN